jgi:hypothetical protein
MQFYEYTYSGIPFHVTLVPTVVPLKKNNFFFLIVTIKANKTPIFVRENVGALL